MKNTNNFNLVFNSLHEFKKLLKNHDFIKEYCDMLSFDAYYLEKQHNCLISLDFGLNMDLMLSGSLGRFTRCRLIWDIKDNSIVLDKLLLPLSKEQIKALIRLIETLEKITIREDF